MADFSSVKRIIRSTRNIFDESKVEIKHGSIYSASGLNYDDQDLHVIRINNYFKFNFSGNVTVSVSENFKTSAFLYTPDLKYIERIPGTIQKNYTLSVENGQLVRFMIKKSDNTDISPEDFPDVKFQIEHGSTPTAYVPHFQEIKKVYHNNEIIFNKSKNGGG